MRVKLEALRFLGEYWQKKGKEKVALNILRLARGMYQEGRNVSEEDLRQVYKESGIE
jgi:hypothetical protein